MSNNIHHIQSLLKRMNEDSINTAISMMRESGDWRPLRYLQNLYVVCVGANILPDDLLNEFTKARRQELAILGDDAPVIDDLGDAGSTAMEAHAIISNARAEYPKRLSFPKCGRHMSDLIIKHATT